MKNGSAWARPTRARASRSRAFAIDLEAGRKHWAYQPLRSFAADASIDHFIDGKLESKGLRKNVRASRRTLIRRLFFDLIGLPPSPDELRRYEDAPYEIDR